MRDYGEPTRLRARRDGDRDLTFSGWKIGTGRHGTGGSSGFERDWTRGVDVTIYLTTGGNLVTSAVRWSRWVGEDGQYAAASHDSPRAALDWLVEDSGNRLGPASKEAWEAACKAYAPLAVEVSEEVV